LRCDRQRVDYQERSRTIKTEDITVIRPRPASISQLYPQLSDNFWMSHVRIITKRAFKEYWWLDYSEVFSAALLAITKAASMFKEGMGRTLSTWLTYKGYHVLTDELRTCDLLARRGHTRSVITKRLPKYYDCPDERKYDDSPPTLCDRLLWGLTKKTQRMMKLYYNYGLTGKEVAACLGISEALFWQRQRACLSLLRKREGVAVEGEQE